MAELLFNFRDLTSVSDPKTPILNLGSMVIPDSFVRKFNPKSYNFYIKFINGLSNPSNLYRFLYTMRDAKSYHNDIETRLSTIAKSLKLLSSEDRKKVIENLKTALNSSNDDKYSNLFNTIQNYDKRTGGDYTIKKPILPMNTFINHINSEVPLLGTTPPKSINDIILDTSGKPSTDESKLKNIDIDKVKGIYNYYKNIPQFSPERININMTDRAIFIITTLIIRILTLSLIYWALNSNLINNFRTAYIYYCCIYILFFTFIVGIVNVIYYYPIFDLFSNVSISNIPNLLYYFYIHINGPNRLILHIVLILLLLFIPFVLDMDKKNIEENNTNISFDYSQKQKIYNSIANFSLIVWILTSIIATKF